MLALSSSEKLDGYYRLMRLDRPVGIYLLLWPTLWALWIAVEGFPDWKILLIFICGVVLMRSAGCVINDYADRNIDGMVKRTTSRPIPTGIVSPKEALALFIGLVLVAFVLVLFTNRITIYYSFGAVLLAAIYPFMKRYTYLPQVVLGAAFAWAVPMAFTAQTETVTQQTWLLYAATLIWTVAYDTLYAMVDRDDDLKIGVKSTAILFGEADKLIVATLQVLVICSMLMLGQQLAMGVIYYLSVLMAAILFAYQQWLIKDRDRDLCFKAFLNNHWVGAALFLGIFTDYFFR